jgi:hypothetical protein
LRLDDWGREKGKFYDPSRPVVVRPLFYEKSIRLLRAPSAVRAFRSGHPQPCVLDLLTRHASAYFPLLPPSAWPSLSSLLLPCMADSFSLLIDDSSPVLSYFPFPDTLSIPNFFEGWNPCFSISACPTLPGQQGNGSSFHVTSQDGAAFSINWWGTPSPNFFSLPPVSISVPTGNGIQLSGIAEGPVTYDLQLDGSTNSSISPSATGGTLLAEYGGLQPGNHTLSLIVHNPTNSTSALIAIDNALITVNSTSPKCVPRRPLPFVLLHAPRYFRY